MTDTFVNVAMYIAPGHAVTYSHRKKAYAALQRYAAEKGRVLIGEPIERPSDYGIHLMSETRAAE